VSLLGLWISFQKASSLFRGMSSPLVGSMFINSILFGVESNIRNNLDFKHTTNDSSRFKYYALSGAIAGYVQGVLITPVELVKIRMQLDDSKYKTTLECVKDIKNKYGYIGFTRGITLGVLRDMPGAAVYFLSFELLLDAFAEKPKHKLWHLLVSGGLAGCLSWAINYPVDVIKTKYQADQKFATARECLMLTLKLEGYRGVWKGLSWALLRAFPCNSACLATVALLQRSFPIETNNKYD
jgi:solute carrier family 25 carnitine/acylcarnitine transporter 20/29